VILAVPGVTGAVVLENEGPNIDLRGIPGHSIWVIVAGGGTGFNAGVAFAVYSKKNAGCGQTNAGSGGAGTASLSGTSVNAISVASGGSGYNNPPFVTLTGGGGSGATAHAVVSGGVIASFVVDTPGTGYTSAPTVNLNPNTIATTFQPPSGPPIVIYFDTPVAQSFYFEAQIDVISGAAPDLTTLANQLAATPYTIGQEADASSLIALIKALYPNVYVSNAFVSLDNATWVPIVSPTGVNYQFNLPVGNITLTT
jgi:hypothetical protein